MTLAVVVGIVLGLSAVALGGKAIVNTIFPKKPKIKPRKNKKLKENVKKAVEEIAKIPVAAFTKTSELMNQSTDLMNSLIASKDPDQNRRQSR